MNVEMFLINLLETGQVCDMIRFKMENRSETYWYLSKVQKSISVGLQKIS